ncbi:Secoisolariciresinol dehydrogenase (Fragment) [Linum perenne]
MISKIAAGFRSPPQLAAVAGEFRNHLFSTLSEPSAAAATSGRKLEGKVAVITGGASGIGKVTASKFITNGAKVIIADINKDLGFETATQLGPNATFVLCDVANESDVADAVDLAVSRHGCLDIMYNNAGIACRTPPSIVDLDLDAFDKVMSINVKGVMAGVKHAARVMIPRKNGGSILCTGSVTGIMGGMAQHTYSISKAAVISIVKSAASELCQHGVRVNGISPFVVPTGLVMEELETVYNGADRERLLEMGGRCEPSDVANAALFLASDDAKYVTGHNLVVDGGFTSFKSLALPRTDQIM